MLNEKQILKMIEKDIAEIEVEALVYEDIGYPDNGCINGLADMYTWQEIETLCKVLQTDSLPYWNTLCKKHPILGDETQ
jgi:hypothetical protein